MFKYIYFFSDSEATDSWKKFSECVTDLVAWALFVGHRYLDFGPKSQERHSASSAKGWEAFNWCESGHNVDKLVDFAVGEDGSWESCHVLEDLHAFG